MFVPLGGREQPPVYISSRYFVILVAMLARVAVVIPGTSSSVPTPSNSFLKYVLNSGLSLLFETDATLYNIFSEPNPDMPFEDRLSRIIAWSEY